MHWTALLAFAASAEAVTMLRFGCAQIVIDRIDPLVNPSQAPTGHIHQIVGGNGFNVTMTTGDVAKTASCTTCQASKDFSNYWTANMYFKAKNGSYKRVPQLGSAYQFNDRFSTQTDGGILVYYVAAAKVTAFKPGFRMLAGDPTKRTAPASNMRMQNCFRCYTGKNFGGDTAAPCAGLNSGLDSVALPTKTCYGIRSNILFPTCWDGKNLDTPNHQDHVTYPTSGPATFLSLGGNCPSTHPVRIPQLMLEVVWDTTQFNDKSIWSTDNAQPFVLSTGDPTGYGQHADYVFGWQDDQLQKAMDASNCNGPACGDILRQPIDDAFKCKVTAKVKENYDQWFTQLPGLDASMPM